MIYCFSFQDDVVKIAGKPTWATRLKNFFSIQHRKIETKKKRRRKRERETNLTNKYHPLGILNAKLSASLWGDAGSMESEGRISTVKVRESSKGRKFFIFECVRYDLVTKNRIYCTLLSRNEKIPIKLLFSLREKGGLSEKEREDAFDRVGKNEIFLSVPPLVLMIIEEFFTPFYAYQVSSSFVTLFSFLCCFNILISVQVMIYLIWIWWTYWFVPSSFISLHFISFSSFLSV